jgi:uncharacterized protein
MFKDPKPIVLDSNLIVSAILSPQGVAAKAFEIADDHFELFATQETLDELRDVLSRDKFDRYISRSDRLSLFEDYAQVVKVVDVDFCVDDCRDPKDNKFLALAIAMKAIAIVTGDKKDLLRMNPYRGINIIGLNSFVESYQLFL